MELYFGFYVCWEVMLGWRSEFGEVKINESGFVILRFVVGVFLVSVGIRVLNLEDVCMYVMVYVRLYLNCCCWWLIMVGIFKDGGLDM